MSKYIVESAMGGMLEENTAVVGLEQRYPYDTASFRCSGHCTEQRKEAVSNKLSY